MGTINMINELYISNLSRVVTNAQLQSYFSLAGKVLSAKVISDKNGFCKGYGFVEMATQEETQNAKNILNHTVLDGMKIEIKE